MKGLMPLTNLLLEQSTLESCRWPLQIFQGHCLSPRDHIVRVVPSPIGIFYPHHEAARLILFRIGLE